MLHKQTKNIRIKTLFSLFFFFLLTYLQVIQKAFEQTQPFFGAWPTYFGIRIAQVLGIRSTTDFGYGYLFPEIWSTHPQMKKKKKKLFFSM